MAVATDSYKRIMVNGVRHYGKHAIVDSSGCNDNLLDKDVIRAWIKELVDRIDMTAFGEPIVERFGGGIETGISAVQLIETSAIVIHTNDQARDMYLDVFSCKDFDENDIVAFVEETFAPAQLNSQVFLRR